MEELALGGLPRANNAMTRPRTNSSPTDALGSSLADLKARLSAVELLAHTPCGGGTGCPCPENVLKTGDTMTGPLVLSGNPTTALQAAPKQYVDSAVATGDATRVAKAGDTMTGGLITTDLRVGTNTATPARLFSTAGDNFNLRTHTNTPNPNLSLGVRNGSGVDTDLPVQWENGTLRLRGSGTNNANGIYVASDNLPRYAQTPNVYGWHTAGQQLGTEMVIGAFARNGGAFGGGAWVWIDVGTVGVTIPTTTTVIEVIFGMSFYTTGGGGFLVGCYYTGTGGSTQLQWFTNEAYSHKYIAGTMGLGVTAGVGTVGLRIYGQGINIQSDANDSVYFTVHTV